MTKKMLIDASHAEETRVVVVDGSRIEELDFESQSRKQLRGNIYLAKVTRVEPSLQAAFIEYGGNRHGFLAFNEIHPDYYQIPVADREALLREEAEEEAELGPEGADSDDEDEMDEVVERRRRRLMRRYKIQEVIKRRQIMLVQVVKEERGNKGAALTTYLSLAGRYCVLMPNTARGGGISRKITSATDRKRLKSAVQSLEVPQGMGLIIRTAGAARTKLEIKRDYEYLMRLWENIREKTLQSIAPALIYEEEDLVKRAIRDMFDKDLESILVEGEAGYREARDFMRMIMPSQAKKVTHYKDPTPLFVRQKIEDQLAQIHSPVVQLRSGGYLVINQTEALVAIDVNSGRSTRERNIETTALKTNLEAAEEAARQLRLRDLAGLIVIDFIDMEEAKNNRAVEKVLKDALKDDRARLQMGKISGFGLMEISRQRRRTGVLEGSTHVCEQCQGTGRVRSIESSAVAALRSIEMEAVRGGAGRIAVRLPSPVGLYVLNEKRDYLAELDRSKDLKVLIQLEDKLGHGEVEIERLETHEGPPRERPAVAAPEPEADWSPPEEIEDAEELEAAPASEEEDRESRRRRRRRGPRRDDGGETRARAASDEEESDEFEADAEEAEGGPEADRGLAAEDEGGSRRRRRRRGRRGGRRLREESRTDVYAWSEPHREGADGQDPYVWREAAPVRGRSEAVSGGEGDGRSEDGAAQPMRAERGERDRGDRERGDRERGERERGERGGRRRGRGRGGRSVDARVQDDEALEVRAETGPEVNGASEVLPGSEGEDLQHEAAAAPEAVQPEAVREEQPAPEVEAPAPAKRVRRPRKAAAAAEPTAAALEDLQQDGAPGDAPAPQAPEADLQPVFAATASPAPEAANESADAEPSEPAAPREPDPSEISAPPATPRRGWWRRLV